MELLRECGPSLPIFCFTEVAEMKAVFLGLKFLLQSKWLHAMVESDAQTVIHSIQAYCKSPSPVHKRWRGLPYVSQIVGLCSSFASFIVLQDT